MHDNTIQQLVYGSTPWSAGYSVLAKSAALPEKICDQLIQYCESYDQQLYATPSFQYSVSAYQLDADHRVLMEIFTGWSDQVGRAARVTRHMVIDSLSWNLLAGDPFLLLWLLAPIRRVVSKKRNEVRILAPITLADLTRADWQRLWRRETDYFFKTIAALPTIERQWLDYLQQQPEPFLPQEIAVEHDCFSLCRAIAYAIPVAKRLQLQCDSFSLNQKPPRGICFRHKLYCSQQRVTAPKPAEKIAWDLPWKIATIVHSLPANRNFDVLASLYRGQKLWHRCYCSLLLVLLVLVILWKIVS